MAVWTCTFETRQRNVDRIGAVAGGHGNTIDQGRAHHRGIRASRHIGGLRRGLDAEPDRDRQIGVPFQPELAAGAVADGDEPTVVLNPKVIEPLGLTEEFLKEETNRKLAEIEERRQTYLAGRERIDPRGTTAIGRDVSSRNTGSMIDPPPSG